MSDTKSVIELLCKQLNCTTGVPMKPEYFRLAKYNKNSPEAIEAFWSVLHNLSTCAVTEQNKSVSFKDYDKITNTKLNFAFLQYSALEFYSIPETDTYNSRELLLALGWLFPLNVMETKVKSNIINSLLGKESSSQVTLQKPLEQINFSSPEDQMKNIVHTCSKLNHNLKQISELISEKMKLTTKVHAASINASGLPHLSVFEMALTKRLSTQRKDTAKDQETIRSLHNLATMLDLHPKWIKKQHIFYEWMITVIEESKAAQKPIFTEDSRLECLKFTTCLRHLVKKKIHAFQNNVDDITNFDSTPDCSSRLLRIQNSETEADTWLEKATKDLELTVKSVEIKEKDLLKELKSMLKLMQNCVRV